MVQMTIQLVALNGKESMTEKQGKLWNKAAVDYFEFYSLISISTPRLRNKIRTQDLQTTNKHASPSPPTLCLTKTAYHTICNTTTPAVYHPFHNKFYNRPHSTPTACLD